LRSIKLVRWAGHFVLKFGSGGGMLFGKDGANTWRSILNRFGSGGQPEVGTGINLSSEWRSNEWHHAAFTWTGQALNSTSTATCAASQPSVSCPW